MTPSRRPRVGRVVQCWSLLQVGFTQNLALNWGPVLGFPGPKEVSRSRSWLVSHEVVTSGSPPERLELCFKRTHYPRESPGPCRPDRIRPPRPRIHVSALDWGAAGYPSVEDGCSTATVPCSKEVAVPATQGHGGRPEADGRARRTNRDPPQYGARVLSRSEPVADAPGRGGSAGANGACAAPA